MHGLILLQELRIDFYVDSVTADFNRPSVLEVPPDDQSRSALPWHDFSLAQRDELEVAAERPARRVLRRTSQPLDRLLRRVIRQRWLDPFAPRDLVQVVEHDFQELTYRSGCGERIP